MRFSPVRGVSLTPDTVCKSRSCRQILSRLRADLRENTTKQLASRDALIQSAGSISNSARHHSDANIALGPILKMYIPGQIRIFNVLISDGYSTGNAPPSGNNRQLHSRGYCYTKRQLKALRYFCHNRQLQPWWHCYPKKHLQLWRYVQHNRQLQARCYCYHNRELRPWWYCYPKRHF